jgi:hypothetical protein
MQMSDGLKIAVVVSLAAILAVFLFGGRYAVVGSASSSLPGAYIIDRFTGSAQFCLGGRPCKALRYLPNDLIPVPQKAPSAGPDDLVYPETQKPAPAP